MVTNAVALAFGFLAGGFARYLVGARLSGLTAGGFPWGTLAVNLTGCLLVGLFDGLAQSRWRLGPGARLVLMTGFCGAYTTFSTLMLETSTLLGAGRTGLALLNFFGSGMAGLALLRLGQIFARAL